MLHITSIELQEYTAILIEGINVVIEDATTVKFPEDIAQIKKENKLDINLGLAPIDVENLVRVPEIYGKGVLVVLCMDTVNTLATIPLAMNLAAYYRNRATWTATYIPVLYKEDKKLQSNNAIVSVAVGAPDKGLWQSFEFKLQCLFCRRNGVEKILQQNAVYPYCREHQNKAFHRKMAYKTGKLNNLATVDNCS